MQPVAVWHCGYRARGNDFYSIHCNFTSGLLPKCRPVSRIPSYTYWRIRPSRGFFEDAGLSRPRETCEFDSRFSVSRTHLRVARSLRITPSLSTEGCLSYLGCMIENDMIE